MKPIQSVLLAMATVALLGATSVGAAAPIEGRNFTRLHTPQPTESQGKVEVIEFFWYGCSHCGKLEPLLKEWLKKLPADVVFKKVPAVLNENWAPGARLYYTLEAMGQLERLSDAVFDAMLNQRINLNNEKILLDWVASKGLDKQKFAETYKSFSVDAKVRKAAEMSQEYGFGGVPALVVGGKYSPGPELASYQQMLEVTDFLINRVRDEQKKAATAPKPAKK